MITVASKVPVYEVDGAETTPTKNCEVVVREHYPKKNMVRLEINGRTYSVLASDLVEAINNALNHNP